MKSHRSLSRRAFVGVAGIAALGSLAGCSGNDSGGDDGNGSTDDPDPTSGTPPDVVTPGNPDDPAPLDPAEFLTYENSAFEYSVQYPQNWELSVPLESLVVVSAPDETAQMVIEVVPEPQQIEDFEAYVDASAEEFGSIDGVELLGQDTLSLPNDRQGFTLDFRVTEGVRFRTRMLLVQRTRTSVYIVQIAIPETIYTDESEQFVRDILGSFTAFGPPPPPPIDAPRGSITTSSHGGGLLDE